LEDTVTDERVVGLFTPDKDSGTRRCAVRATVLAARRGTVCGEVGRVLRFPQSRSAPSKRILKTQASLTAHWHDKGADWRGLAHTPAHHRSRLSDSVKNGNALRTMHNAALPAR